MPPHLRIYIYGLFPYHVPEHPAERFRRPLELDHLARELVDPARHAGIASEDLGLYLLDIVLEAVDYGSVVVYDTVHYGVQDRLWSTPQVFGVGLQLLAYPAQVRRLAVAHAHHKVFSHKEVDLAELDPLLLVQVTGRLEHEEERIAVALQLGPLVGVRRILDRQPVQAELPGDGGELLFRRPVEADPSHTAPVPDGLVGLLEGDRLGGPVAVHVDGVVHDHGRIIRLCLSLPACLSAATPCTNAPLLVGFTLEDGERSALGIAEDGDPARGEIQGPVQYGAAKLACLLHGGVARGDREVREPEGRRVAVLFRHRHETAVLVAGVLDRGVDEIGRASCRERV